METIFGQVISGSRGGRVRLAGPLGRTFFHSRTEDQLEINRETLETICRQRVAWFYQGKGLLT